VEIYFTLDFEHVGFMRVLLQVLLGLEDCLVEVVVFKHKYSFVELRVLIRFESNGHVQVVQLQGGLLQLLVDLYDVPQDFSVFFVESVYLEIDVQGPMLVCPRPHENVALLYGVNLVLNVTDVVALLDLSSWHVFVFLLESLVVYLSIFGIEVVVVVIYVFVQNVVFYYIYT